MDISEQQLDSFCETAAEFKGDAAAFAAYLTGTYQPPETRRRVGVSLAAGLALSGIALSGIPFGARTASASEVDSPLLSAGRTPVAYTIPAPATTFERSIILPADSERAASPVSRPAWPVDLTPTEYTLPAKSYRAAVARPSEPLSRSSAIGRGLEKTAEHLLVEARGSVSSALAGNVAPLNAPSPSHTTPDVPVAAHKIRHGLKQAVQSMPIQLTAYQGPSNKSGVNFADLPVESFTQPVPVGPDIAVPTTANTLPGDVPAAVTDHVLAQPRLQLADYQVHTGHTGKHGGGLSGAIDFLKTPVKFVDSLVHDTTGFANAAPSAPVKPFPAPANTTSGPLPNKTPESPRINFGSTDVKDYTTAAPNGVDVGIQSAVATPNASLPKTASHQAAPSAAKSPVARAPAQAASPRSGMSPQEAAFRAKFVRTMESQLGVTDGTRYSARGVNELWCDDFQSWSLKVAGRPLTGTRSQGVIDNWDMPSTVNTLHLMQHRPGMHAYTAAQVRHGVYTPKPGDIVFDKYPDNNHEVNHVAAVDKMLSPHEMLTIGGNQGNGQVTTYNQSIYDPALRFIVDSMVVMPSAPAPSKHSQPAPAPSVVGSAVAHGISFVTAQVDQFMESAPLSGAVIASPPPAAAEVPVPANTAPSKPSRPSTTAPARTVAGPNAPAAPAQMPASPVAPDHGISFGAVPVNQFIEPAPPSATVIASPVPAQANTVPPDSSQPAAPVTGAPTTSFGANIQDYTDAPTPGEVVTAPSSPTSPSQPVTGGQPAVPNPSHAPGTPAPVPSAQSAVSSDVVAHMLPGASPAAIKQNYSLLVKALADQGLADKQMELYAFATINAEDPGFTPIAERHPDPSYGKYYGRGEIQLTWDYNYRAAGAALGVDLAHNPDLALQPEVAARVMAWYLKRHEGAIRSSLNKGDLSAARVQVNGGTNGLSEFESSYHIGQTLTDKTA